MFNVKGLTMKVSLVLSIGEGQGVGCSGNPFAISRQATQVCASQKLAANVVPLFSSIKDKESDNYHGEAGCRIDILPDLPRQRADDILYLFKRLQDVLGIYCVWLDVDGPWQDVTKTPCTEFLHDSYHGCILEWSHYQANYNLIHDKPLPCNPEPETQEQQKKARLDTFENGQERKASFPLSRLRNGKPLS